MEFINYSPIDECDKCGEIFMTLKGNIVFQCSICEYNCKDIKDYVDHITVEHYSIPALEEEHIEDEVVEQKLLETDNKEDNLPTWRINTANQIEDDGIIETKTDFNEGIIEIEVTTKVEDEEKEETEPNTSHLIDTTSDYENTIETAFVDTDKTTKKTSKFFEQQYKVIKSNSPDKNRFKCTECDFSCKDKSNLMGHIKRHSTNKAHACTQCDKRFHTKTELKAHYRRHTGERPFLCTDCGQTFFTSGILSAHIKRHKNIRNKECNFCHKKFFDAGALVNHLRVHTGDRPFQCKLCPSSFKRGNALVSHMKMHENKREFQCEFCPSKFNQKCNLNAHRKSKHFVILAKIIDS